MLYQILSKGLNLLYSCVLVAVSPFLIYKMVCQGKYWPTLQARWGKVSLPNKATIWIHGVSVGEIKAAASLVAALSQEIPPHKIVISSTSRKGLETAQALYPQHPVISFPLDFSWTVNQFLRQIAPQLIILIELEIWPNFLLATQQHQIPVLLVNGRFSEKSSKRYGWINKLFLTITDNIRVFSVQSPVYAQRLKQLGVPADKIKVTGNLKFDNVATAKEFSAQQQEQLQQLFAIDISKELVIVAGSTHWPEEKYLVESYAQLKEFFPGLRLVIVPRHPERASSLQHFIRQLSYAVSLKSQLTAKQDSVAQIIIGDTMGELSQIYQVADIVFIGGSLLPHGGQNFIEASAQKKAVVCGPHMENFPDIKVFLEEQAICQVSSPENLTGQLKELCADTEKRKTLGEKAQHLVELHQGSTQRNLQLCHKLLKQ